MAKVFDGRTRNHAKAICAGIQLGNDAPIVTALSRPMICYVMYYFLLRCYTVNVEKEKLESNRFWYWIINKACQHVAIWLFINSIKPRTDFKVRSTICKSYLWLNRYRQLVWMQNMRHSSDVCVKCLFSPFKSFNSIKLIEKEVFLTESAEVADAFDEKRSHKTTTMTQILYIVVRVLELIIHMIYPISKSSFQRFALVQKMFQKSNQTQQIHKACYLQTILEASFIVMNISTSFMRPAEKTFSLLKWRQSTGVSMFSKTRILINWLRCDVYVWNQRSCAGWEKRNCF